MLLLLLKLEKGLIDRLSLHGKDAGKGSGEVLHGMLLETNAAVVRPGFALDPAGCPR